MLSTKDITKAIMIKAALRLRFPDLSQVTGLSDRVLRLILTEGHTNVSATTEGRLKEFINRHARSIRIIQKVLRTQYGAPEG